MFSDPFSLAAILGGSSYPGMQNANLPTLPGLGGIGAAQPSQPLGFDLAAEWEKFFNTARQEPTIGDKLLMLGTALSTGNGMHEGLANAAYAFQQNRQSQQQLETQLGLERLKQLQQQDNVNQARELEKQKLRLTERELESSIEHRDKTFDRQGEQFDKDYLIKKMQASAQIAQANAAAAANGVNAAISRLELTTLQEDQANTKRGLLSVRSADPTMNAMAASANVEILKEMKAAGVDVATPEMQAAALQKIQKTRASLSTPAQLDPANLAALARSLPEQTLDPFGKPMTDSFSQARTGLNDAILSLLGGQPNISAAGGNHPLSAGDIIKDPDDPNTSATVVSFDGRTLKVKDANGNPFTITDPNLIKKFIANKVK